MYNNLFTSNINYLCVCNTQTTLNKFNINNVVHIQVFNNFNVTQFVADNVNKHNLTVYNYVNKHLKNNSVLQIYVKNYNNTYSMYFYNANNVIITTSI